MDYIKREDALTDFMCEGVSCNECPFKENGCRLEKFIIAIPAADVRENVHGHWVFKDGKIFCSHCNKPQFEYRTIDWDWEPKFCPNCGAYMRED